MEINIGKEQTWQVDKCLQLEDTIQTKKPAGELKI
jgi:hypothetical protein